MKLPWTKAEVDRMLPQLKRQLAEIENAETEEVRPIPQMTQDEALDYMHRLMNIAEIRPLTSGETFLHGQLVSVYRMAVLSEALGYDKTKRYFVFSEDDLKRMIPNLEAN